MGTFLEVFSQIRIAGRLGIHLRNNLLVRGETAGKKKVVLKQKLTVMAHVKLCHLVLNIPNTSEAGSLLHHLNHVFVFKLGSYVVSVLHKLPEPDILHLYSNTLWQTNEKRDFTPVR